MRNILYILSSIKVCEHQLEIQSWVLVYQAGAFCLLWDRLAVSMESLLTGMDSPTHIPTL